VPCEHDEGLSTAASIITKHRGRKPPKKGSRAHARHCLDSGVYDLDALVGKQLSEDLLARDRAMDEGPGQPEADLMIWIARQPSERGEVCLFRQDSCGFLGARPHIRSGHVGNAGWAVLSLNRVEGQVASLSTLRIRGVELGHGWTAWVGAGSVDTGSRHCYRAR
jgi:hypothetical protein